MSLLTDRQSIRKFNEVVVNPSVVRPLIEAAMAAPSSKNKQPWQFVVLDQTEILAAFTDAHPNWAVLKTANKAILVCGDLERDERTAQMLMACSAATQNILLKATELSVGSLWVGLYPDETRMAFTKEKLGLPEHVLPISLIALGHHEPKKPKTRLLDDSRIHYNHW